MLWVLIRIASPRIVYRLGKEILMSTHNIVFDKEFTKIIFKFSAVLMSTHNIVFDKEFTKIIFKLSPNTHLISSSAYAFTNHFQTVCPSASFFTFFLGEGVSCFTAGSAFTFTGFAFFFFFWQKQHGKLL